MTIDENRFFREATMRLCGSLDTATSLRRCLAYLSDYMPADLLILFLLDESLGGLRCIAYASLYEERKADEFIPVPPDVRERMRRHDMPHVVVERPGFSAVTVRIANRMGDDPATRTFKDYSGLHDHSALVMYLTLEGKEVGTLVLQAEGADRYKKEHARFLALLREPFAITLSNALESQRFRTLKDLLADDNRYLHRELLRISGDQIVGGEYGLKAVTELVRQVAPLASPVLLRGETGAGKDVIANAIHYSSPLKQGPFIKVNCGAIPETLIDSELFGHEKGAFTGAIARKRGCFERANHGTIFLDEIGDLPLSAQARMLRVLQYKEVQRVGGTDPVRVEIRVIAATHRNLEEMLKEGRFREDLWFRLNVFPIFIPPLRERKNDIPALVHHLILRKTRDLKLATIPVLAPGVIDRLMDYDWPGNVRELENAIERALIVNRGSVLGLDSFFFREEKPSLPATEENGVLLLDEAVSRHIRKVLSMTRGRINGPDGAAHLLGVNPSTLRNRMNVLAIPYGKSRKGPAKR